MGRQGSGIEKETSSSEKQTFVCVVVALGSQ